MKSHSTSASSSKLICPYEIVVITGSVHSATAANTQPATAVRGPAPRTRRTDCQLTTKSRTRLATTDKTFSPVMEMEVDRSQQEGRKWRVGIDPMHARQRAIEVQPIADGQTLGAVHPQVHEARRVERQFEDDVAEKRRNRQDRHVGPASPGTCGVQCRHARAA